MGPGLVQLGQVITPNPVVICGQRGGVTLYKQDVGGLLPVVL